MCAAGRRRATLRVSRRPPRGATVLLHMSAPRKLRSDGRACCERIGILTVRSRTPLLSAQHHTPPFPPSLSGLPLQAPTTPGHPELVAARRAVTGESPRSVDGSGSGRPGSWQLESDAGGDHGWSAGVDGLDGPASGHIFGHDRWRSNDPGSNRSLICSDFESAPGRIQTC